MFPDTWPVYMVVRVRSGMATTRAGVTCDTLPYKPFFFPLLTGFAQLLFIYNFLVAVRMSDLVNNLS